MALITSSLHAAGRLRARAEFEKCALPVRGSWRLRPKGAQRRLVKDSILFKLDLSRAMAEERLRVIFCARSTIRMPNDRSARRATSVSDHQTISATSDELLILVQTAPDALRASLRGTRPRARHFKPFTSRPVIKSWHLAVDSWQKRTVARVHCQPLTASCQLLFPSSSQERFKSTCQKS